MDAAYLNLVFGRYVNGLSPASVIATISLVVFGAGMGPSLVFPLPKKGDGRPLIGEYSAGPIQTATD
jgi:hypothetical protein